MSPILLALALFVSFLLPLAEAFPELRVAPNPGDLSQIRPLLTTEEQALYPGHLLLAESTDYTVEVRKTGDTTYTPCFVYRSNNNWRRDLVFGGPNYPVFSNAVRPQFAAHYTHFSFVDTSVDVRVTFNFSVNAGGDAIKIRPLSYGIDFVRAGNVITFTLERPHKISIEVNDRRNPLFLFSDEPDVAPTPDSVDFYYGPGVHNIGLNKLLPSGSQVYIAAGAVVVGSFRLQTPSTNVTIRGRGILTMCPWPHNYDNEVVWLRDHSPINAPRSTATSEALFEGITIDNATGWHFALEVYNYQNQNNRYRNLKLVAFNANTDALWMDGNNITADDCFIFNHDDQITTHGSQGNRVSNCVIWGGTRGHLFAQYNFGSNRHFLIENIEVIGQDGGAELILISPAGGEPKVAENITFRNIRIEEHPSLSSRNWDMNRFIHAPTEGKVTVTNWVFENVTIADKNPSEALFSGCTEARPLSMTFRNLKMGGSSVNSLAEANMSATGSASLTFSVDAAFDISPNVPDSNFPHVR